MNYLAFLRTFEPRDCTLVPNFLFLVRLTPSRKLELSNSPSNYVRVMLLYFFHLFPVTFLLEWSMKLVCSARICFTLLSSNRCALSFPVGYLKSLACCSLSNINVSILNRKLASMQMWQCPTKCQERIVMTTVHVLSLESLAHGLAKSPGMVSQVK